ncbi:hypothetical protein JTB14_025900 [Gonioctena quinquepunctata]|nr:hypothetical protein JTB14_025900 [Gonioctena quinquepunctata]
MSLVYKNNNNQSASVENNQTIECYSVPVQDEGLTNLENDTILKHYINADKKIEEHQEDSDTNDVVLSQETGLFETFQENRKIVVILQNLKIISVFIVANLNINQPSCSYYYIEEIEIISDVQERIEYISDISDNKKLSVIVVRTLEQDTHFANRNSEEMHRK